MSKQSMFVLGAVAFVLSLTSSSLAIAQVTLHDTTGDALDTNWLVGLSPSSPTINQPADSFVVAGGSFFLDSLTLNLSSTSNASGGTPDDYEIRFWDNNVDVPGNLLESFTVAGSGTLTGLTTVTSVTKPLLSDGTTYWVSAALPDDLSDGTWEGVLGVSNGRAVAFSNSATASWIATGNRVLSLKVTGTPIPEPSAAALLFCGLCCLARRREL
ncbi:hypothetical protein N9N28_14990 [Rubripirellula amarantea]|nr:hypothetical protein [Rubripirellula amarantea]